MVGTEEEMLTTTYKLYFDFLNNLSYPFASPDTLFSDAFSTKRSVAQFKRLSTEVFANIDVCNQYTVEFYMLDNVLNGFGWFGDTRMLDASLF